MKISKISVSRGWAMVKIRGAGGVKNRLLPTNIAVKRCLRLPSIA